MATIQQRFDVERPVSAVYETLSQPQAVLQMLPAVISVERVSEDRYRIRAGAMDSPREIEVQITAKVPPRQIEWRTTDDRWSGAVTLEPLGPDRTSVAVAAEGVGGTENDAASTTVMEAVQILKHAIQASRVHVSSGSGYGRGASDAGRSGYGGAYGNLAGGARRYASEWRDTAQSALTRPTEFPFRLMRTISRQMDRVWGDMWRAAPMSRLPNLVPGMPWNPDVEVCEQDDQVRICIDVPGVDESNIQVEVDEHMLTVRGERQDDRSSDPGPRRSEFHYGAFTRRVPLPDGVDADNARAVLRNGVLEVRIPMHRKPPRRVPVQQVPS